MVSPIIIFNPEGLTKEQFKLVKQALDDAYRAGYETAKEVYQIKFNTSPSKDDGKTWTTAPMPPNTYEINNCSHGIEQGTYPTAMAGDYPTLIQGTSLTAAQKNCNHSYVNAENKAKGICGKCGISFDAWHG